MRSSDPIRFKGSGGAPSKAPPHRKYLRGDKTMKYFTNINTLDELKKAYRRLAMQHHPDCGGDTETMAATPKPTRTNSRRLAASGPRTRESGTGTTPRPVPAGTVASPPWRKSAPSTAASLSGAVAPRTSKPLQRKEAVGHEKQGLTQQPKPLRGSTGTAPPVLTMAGQKGKELELAAQH